MKRHFPVIEVLVEASLDLQIAHASEVIAEEGPFRIGRGILLNGQEGSVSGESPQLSEQRLAMVWSSLALDLGALDSDREAREAAELWLTADRRSQGTKGGDAKTKTVLQKLGLALGSELRIFRVSTQSIERITHHPRGFGSGFPWAAALAIRVE